MANTAITQPLMPPEQEPVDHDRTSILRPLSTRALYFVQLWSMKAVVRTFLLAKHYIIGSEAALLPTYYKTYKSPANIAAHVFIPKTWKAGDPPLPLLIDIHGGGFAIGSPLIDDRENAALAHEHGFAVVSIGYRLAPSYPYPAAIEDVATQIEQILDDDELPVDRSRVATIGYSAGGNLALTAPQLRGLHKRLVAAVAYYPAVDMVIKIEQREKLQTHHPDGRPDVLKRGVRFFSWGYVPAGAPMKDPLLSPRFAPRDVLPRHIYLLGAEYDMLCNDAWRMAEELAVKEGVEKVSDERGGDRGWECGNVRWKRVLGVEHGWNLSPITVNSEEGKFYRKKAAECQKDVAEWLWRGPFAEKK